MPASRRTALPALTVSVMLHAMLLWSMPPVAPSAVHRDGLDVVRIRLQWSEPASPDQPEEGLRRLQLVATGADIEPAPAIAAATDLRRMPADSVQSDAGNGDSAIYDVHELDRFPRPLTALLLPVPDPVPAGRLRARVVISRAGQVLQVDVVDGPAALADSAKRLLTQSRFNPAMRDGRVVDSRTLIELAYAPLPEG